ncbi:large ribosomal subunit protein uL22 [Mycoplasmopsis bovis]|uniref:large ribosomal subunit protein uL22 n=1 Tax=Mycoplasmopsis bovis TaxID=28903 RepID=UPI003D2A2FB5
MAMAEFNNLINNCDAFLFVLLRIPSATLTSLPLNKSAIANATNNHGMDASKLFVKEVLVNEGPTLKRYQPRSQGRAYSIFKRTSNLSIALEERA